LEEAVMVAGDWLLVLVAGTGHRRLQLPATSN
jgi:hypothetical protein